MPFEENPLWYKDAIVYQVHVKAFFDSDGDGIGDFGGLTQKLDYLQDLGVTALWLLPFYPSPLKDDGYDIADYDTVHPSYGTLNDFRLFMREAHRRGIRVITELVINHTSDQHPWFQRARTAKAGSAARDFYVWSDTVEKYQDARIIFKDFELSNWSWDPVAKAFYWHRFYSHQPDLNFENPRVKRAVFKALDFWMNMGVDGMRLDAIPYLFERDGTNCENLPETHAFLKELRHHVDRHHKNRMLLAEANQWPEDSVAYFGDNDECHMSFHFPVMPRMFMAVRMEDRFPIIDILKQTPAIPEASQWALFLRNHDELTLEMVTDEERDYMYRVYAHDQQARINLGIRRRLAPLMSNNRRKLELMNGLLFSLPGTPVIYYGDEIGLGDNIYLGDRNGVRTPMQWSADRNAGFSAANPQKLYLPVIIDPEYHYEALNVEAQQKNPQSLLWWMKRLIALRKKHKAFGRGSIRFLYPDNSKVLAFVRTFETETILVVANLSRFAQHADLDLSDYKGLAPIELFGHNAFPTIGEGAYSLTLGPHNFFWFSIEAAPDQQAAVPGVLAELPTLTVDTDWETLLTRNTKARFEAILPAFLRSQRWFGSKARSLKSVTVQESIPIQGAKAVYAVALLNVEYNDGDPETYVLPLCFMDPERAEKVRQEKPYALVAKLNIREKDQERDGFLCDAVVDPDFCKDLLQTIEKRRVFRGDIGEFAAVSEANYRTLRGPAGKELEPALLNVDQSNTSIVYGSRLILKLIRKIENGVNPELEIGRFLMEKRALAHVPAVAGAIEYRHGREEPATVAILEGYVHNEGNAWGHALDALSRFFEKAQAYQKTREAVPLYERSFIKTDITPSSTVRDLMETYLESAQLLGRRTAEFHSALTLDPDDEAFKPEPFTKLYQRSIYQSMRNATAKSFQLLSRRVKHLSDEDKDLAEKVLDSEEHILNRFKQLVEVRINASRIRVHGDYHLGQILNTGKDFVIIDLEGEPARALSERRLKRSPLRDVAGLLRSFHYASEMAVWREAERGMVRPEQFPVLKEWGRFWYHWASTSFMRCYLDIAGRSSFLPRSRDELSILLDAYLLEKAVYELSYELNNRPAWIHVPLAGILELLSLPSAMAASPVKGA